jgi:secretion/DNA translocation related TadE-like protein
VTSREERGSAVPFAIACIGLLLLLGAALGVVTAMVRAHRSAQSAADLSALAVADTVGSGSDPCSTGRVVAEANGARLVACGLDGRDATVTVLVGGPHWLGQMADLSAQARAGPG